MTIVYVAIGVLIGTFIPMPQQQLVRRIAKSGWEWVSSKLNA